MKYTVTIAIFLFISFFPAKSQRVGSKNSINREISVDFNKVSGPLNTMFNICVGAGRANEGLRADWQQQLIYTKQQCGFRYIRMHGLLCDDMGVYFEDKKGNPVYNWQYIDKLYDFLLSINIKPFVELGFMPNALASGPQTIFWWKGNVTPPKDYQKWSELMKNLVTHFTQRYGHDEVKSWYFEVWNEPNLNPGFFTGNRDEYFKLYAVTAKAIKSVSPDYKVGGPATAGSAWIPEFIDFCVKNNVPVDFVSTHTYGVNQGFLDADGSTGTILSADPQSIYGETIRSRKQITESAKPNLELHYTEWSSSYTPSDPIHDSYHQAAYILNKLKNSGNAPTSMSYWVFTDIFEEAGPRTTPFHGGFGLLNYQGIRKPAFFSYHFLNKLGDTELVNSDKASWVCKDERGNIQALFWDFTNTHPGDSVNNQVYYKRNLPSSAKGNVKLKFTSIPTGKYLCSVYKVGYRSNDAYTTYLDMGSPNQLDPAQVKAISEINSGIPESQAVVQVSTENNFAQEFPMRENDVYFVTLEKL